MKKYFKFLTFLFLSLCMVLTSCSEEEDINSDENTNSVVTTKSELSNTIIVPEQEIMDMDAQFEEDYKIDNLNYDSDRESYINIDANELYVPIQVGYILNLNNPKNGIKNPVKEVGAGIKFNVARKKPRSDPNKCQGDCKCGVGFRCGNSKYIYAKSNNSDHFNFEDREAVGKIFIDEDNHYLIIKFTTQDIPWVELNNE